MLMTLPTQSRRLRKAPASETDEATDQGVGGGGRREIKSVPFINYLLALQKSQLLSDDLVNGVEIRCEEKGSCPSGCHLCHHQGMMGGGSGRSRNGNGRSGEQSSPIPVLLEVSRVVPLYSLIQDNITKEAFKSATMSSYWCAGKGDVIDNWCRCDLSAFSKDGLPNCSPLRQPILRLAPNLEPSSTTVALEWMDVEPLIGCKVSDYIIQHKRVEDPSEAEIYTDDLIAKNGCCAPPRHELRHQQIADCRQGAKGFLHLTGHCPHASLLPDYQPRHPPECHAKTRGRKTVLCGRSAGSGGLSADSLTEEAIAGEVLSLMDDVFSGLSSSCVVAGKRTGDHPQSVVYSVVFKCLEPDSLYRLTKASVHLKTGTNFKKTRLCCHLWSKTTKNGRAVVAKGIARPMLGGLESSMWLSRVRLPDPTMFAAFTLAAVDNRGSHTESSFVSVRTSCPVVDDSRAEEIADRVYNLYNGYTSGKEQQMAYNMLMEIAPPLLYRVQHHYNSHYEKFGDFVWRSEDELGPRKANLILRRVETISLYCRSLLRSTHIQSRTDTLAYIYCRSEEGGLPSMWHGSLHERRALCMEKLISLQRNTYSNTKLRWNGLSMTSVADIEPQDCMWSDSSIWIPAGAFVAYITGYGEWNYLKMHQPPTVLKGQAEKIGVMFYRKVLVPLFIPLGYAATTGLKKVYDRYFPGKDSSEGYNQDDEDDLFWKDLPSNAKEQTDLAGEVCSEKGTDVCVSDSDPTRTTRDSTEDDGTVSGQTDPAGEVCSEQLTNVCGIPNIGVTETVQDSTEENGTVFEQTDLAGEICSKTMVHSECENTVAEKSNPDGEDLSAGDLTAEAVAEVIAQALVSLVPSLSFPDKSSLKSTFTSVFQISSSLDGEHNSDENGVINLSQKMSVNAKITVVLEVYCSLDVNSKHRVGSVIPDVGRTATAGQGQMEENLFKFSSKLHNSWVNATFQSVLNLSVTRRCLGQERVFLEASSIPCCASLILSAVRQPGKHFSQKDLSPVLMKLREKTLSSDVGREYDIKCLLESVLVWLDSFGGDTDRGSSRTHQVVANQTMDVPADCECGTERYHLSSIICGDSKPAKFYSYSIKGEQTVKADNEHVFTADSDCSEDMSQNVLIYIYKKLRNDETPDVTVSPAPPLEDDKEISVQTSHPELGSGTESLCIGGKGSEAGRLPGPQWSKLKQRQPVGFQLGGKAVFCAKLAGSSSLKFQPSPARPKAQSLPLDVSISTIGTPKFMHQRWRGLTHAHTGDCLDLVGVRDMQYHVSTQKPLAILNKPPLLDGAKGAKMLDVPPVVCSGLDEGQWLDSKRSCDIKVKLKCKDNYSCKQRQPRELRECHPIAIVNTLTLFPDPSTRIGEDLVGLGEVRLPLAFICQHPAIPRLAASPGQVATPARSSSDELAKKTFRYITNISVDGGHFVSTVSFERKEELRIAVSMFTNSLDPKQPTSVTGGVETFVVQAWKEKKTKNVSMQTGLQEGKEN
ncbi:hypothetical protein CCH79_00000959 [Gambusia affinis]|uniref:Astrotactin-2 n=1 Tax=Gambusia affinis TaxID=33528 RepID=A0A315VU28_GAMAF|nr:hypothetical protein CCH79_00000959 [Gambusia affinis]